MPILNASKKFNPGQIVATNGIAIKAEQDKTFGLFCGSSLCRHLRGEWGDINPGDIGLNEKALEDGDRLLSVYAYPLDSKVKIWIITEADRSVTTILFPEEY